MSSKKCEAEKEEELHGWTFPPRTLGHFGPLARQKCRPLGPLGSRWLKRDKSREQGLAGFFQVMIFGGSLHRTEVDARCRSTQCTKRLKASALLALVRDPALHITKPKADRALADAGD